MSEQHLLSKSEVESAKKAHDAILKIGSWTCTEPGERFWIQARSYLRAMIEFGTSNGKAFIEPNITDEDACKRIPVMARDNKTDSWTGPLVLIRVRNLRIRQHKYLTEHRDESTSEWAHARRLTPDEQAVWEASQ